MNNKIAFLIILFCLLLSSNIYGKIIDFSDRWKSTLMNDQRFINVNLASFKHYDFSSVLSNIDRPGFIRREYIGIFGPNYRKIEFFLTANKCHSKLYKYVVKGKSKLNNNIRPIYGIITLLSIRKQNYYEGFDDVYLGIFDYELKEPGSRKGDGVYKGILSVMFIFDNDKLRFYTPSDGSFSEYYHMFVGVWEKYNSDVKRKCIFSYGVAGLFMKLPYCEEFIQQSKEDDHVYEINDKFKKYGWSDYDPINKGSHTKCWWK